MHAKEPRQDANTSLGIAFSIELPPHPAEYRFDCRDLTRVSAFRTLYPSAGKTGPWNGKKKEEGKKRGEGRDKKEGKERKKETIVSL